MAMCETKYFHNRLKPPASTAGCTQTWPIISATQDNCTGRYRARTCDLHNATNDGCMVATTEGIVALRLIERSCDNVFCTSPTDSYKRNGYGVRCSNRELQTCLSKLERRITCTMHGLPRPSRKQRPW